MTQNSWEQLKILSDKIQQEEQALRSKHWADLLELNGDSEADWKSREEWSASLFLRALRIYLCLDQTGPMQAQIHSQFLQDWADAVEAVKKLSNSSEQSGLLL